MSIGRNSTSAAEIAKALGGRRHAGYWTAKCPAHDDRSPSFSIRDGDNGQPLVHCFSGCSQREVIDALRALGLWPDHGDRREWRRSPPKSRKARTDTSAQAVQIWRESLDPRGTTVERYLASRGLTLPEGVANHRVIRFHPACPFGTRRRLPCLIARFSPILNDFEPEAPPTAIHRIRLDRFKGDDRKMSLGPTKGQVVKLSHDEDVTLGLHLAEGIETALALAKHWLPIWACTTAGTIKTFPLLNGIECLTLFADHDMAGFEAAQKCAERWQVAGYEVFIRWTDKIGSDFADEVKP